MKIKIKQDRTGRCSGGVLVVGIVMLGVAGLSLAGYLGLISHHYGSVIRSHNWSRAYTVAEAGIEEAMTQMNFVEGNDLTVNGWPLVEGKYTKERTLDNESFYRVTIDPDTYTILSEGYARSMPDTNYVRRRLEGQTEIANSVFTDAMIAKKHIKLRAAGIADSYDSGGRGRGRPRTYNGNGLPSWLGWGKGWTQGKGKKGPGSVFMDNPGVGYFATNRHDNCNIAVTSQKKNAIKVQRTKVYGSAKVAPKGNVEIKDKGSVGSRAWVEANQIGVQAGHLFTDYTYSFPNVAPPFTTGQTPVAGKINGVDAQYILGTGNYMLGKVSLTKDIYVNGDAVLYLTDDFKSSGKSIIMNTNTTLKIYMGGRHFHLEKADGVLNHDVAAAFQYYALPNNKCVKLDKKQDFSGVIYAPRAKIRLSGDKQFFGSVVGKCIHADHGADFHYDEALGRLYGDFEQFVLTSLREF